MSDRDMFDFLDEAQGINVPKRDWMDDKKFVLVNAENIKECIDSCISSGLYALDLETTGLDNRIEPNGHTRDKIVGVCLSPDGITGYYIPVRHVEVKADGSRSMRDCNVPWTVFEKEFRRLMKETAEGNTVAIFHNGKFDQEFLQYPGGEPFLDWDKATCWEDSMLLAYLADSRRRSKQLKYLTDKELGFDQVELKELFPENHKGPYDFSVLDPTEQGVLWYGGGDGIFTFLLHKHFLHQVIDADTDGKTQKGIYVIEKLCVAAIRWMERCRIHVDIDRVKELVQLGQNEWFESIIEVYEEASNILNRDVMPGTYKVLKDSFVGDDFDYLLPQQIGDAKAKAKSVHPDPVIQVKTDGRSWPSIYDVNSPQQLGKMFDEMGVPGLKRTEKSGQVATGKKELDRIVEVAGEEFPFMSRIKRFREINKALSSYLFPMLLDVDPSDSTMRINYRQDGTDTGRFSTPAKDSARGKLIGFPEVNLQSIPSTYNPQRPACMNRLRECITPRKPNSFIVAIDYAGEELRLITNLSREPKWMEEFFHCASCDRTFPKGDGSSTPEPPPPRCPNCGSDKIGDLHTLTGLELYGPEAPEKPEWKALRGYAKGTNFALSYGGGGSAVSRSTGVDKQEGWRIKRQFDRTYSGLRGWWGAQHNFGRKNGFVRTAFGRKYPVPDITHPDGGFRAKAERNSVNGPIQGSGADMMKIAMVLVYKEMRKREWLDKCMMISTMHDELVFEIDGDILAEAINVIVPIMTSNKFIVKQNWPIPFTCDVEIGTNWTVPWDLNAMRYGEVRFVGDKKYYKAEDLPSGYDWDETPSWPATLMELFPEAKKESSTPPPPSSGSSSGTDSQSSPESNEPPPTPGAVGMQPPSTEVGGNFVYRLSAPLTMETIINLSHVISRCRNGGTRKLRLESNKGETLDKWIEELGFTEFLVNDQQFYFLAQEHGL